MGTPRSEVCSAAPETPTAPVPTPTDTPESIPVVTEEPTVAPVEETDEPTEMEKKTEEPTDPETDAPTFVPTFAPVESPVAEPDSEDEAPTKQDKGGKDDKDTGTGTEPEPEPTIEPTIKPDEGGAVETTVPSDEEVEYPIVDMSMSYAFDSEDIDDEWGRSGKKQKKAKDEGEDEHRSKVRQGKRGRYRY